MRLLVDIFVFADRHLLECLKLDVLDTICESQKWLQQRQPRQICLVDLISSLRIEELFMDKFVYHDYLSNDTEKKQAAPHGVPAGGNLQAHHEIAARSLQ